MTPSVEEFESEARRRQKKILWSYCGKWRPWDFLYRPVWLGLRQGVFTCVGWKVTLCDPIWQAVWCSSSNSYTLPLPLYRLTVSTVNAVLSVLIVGRVQLSASTRWREHAELWYDAGLRPEGVVTWLWRHLSADERHSNKLGWADDSRHGRGKRLRQHHTCKNRVMMIDWLMMIALFVMTRPKSLVWTRLKSRFNRFFIFFMFC